MMGTLATVLAGSKIPTFSDRYRADVEGDIEDVDGVLRITRIRVAYTLSVPPGKTGEAREALKTYITKCPAAMSAAAIGGFAAPATTPRKPKAAKSPVGRCRRRARAAPLVAPMKKRGVTIPPLPPVPRVTVVATIFHRNARVAVVPVAAGAVSIVGTPRPAYVSPTKA